MNSDVKIMNPIDGNDIASIYSGHSFNKEPFNVYNGGVITLNGAAAAGKGTIAKQLAEKKGLENIIVLGCSDLLNHKTLSKEENEQILKVVKNYENLKKYNTSIAQKLNYCVKNGDKEGCHEPAQIGILEIFRKHYDINFSDNQEKRDDLLVTFYQTLGELVPNNIYDKRVLMPIATALKQEGNHLLVLDGCTRTEAQVYEINDFVKSINGRGLDASLFVDIKKSVAVARAEERAIENPGARNDVEKTGSRVDRYESTVPHLLNAHKNLGLPNYLTSAGVDYKDMGNGALDAFESGSKYKNKFFNR